MEKIYKFVIKPIIKLYLKAEPTVRIDGFKIKVFKTVFHPSLFFSTKFFYSFLIKQELTNKKFLEIGCGTGILSMLAYKKKAIVTACDINLKAIENAKYNFENNITKNSNSYVLLESDVFLKIPIQEFDVIAINPPYYFKEINVAEQYAWNCGENGEYFEKLFSQLRNYMNTNTKVFMILAEVCDIDRIKSIATKNKFVMNIVEEKKIKWERSFIFLVEMMN